jgi:hypothetical protein
MVHFLTHAMPLGILARIWKIPFEREIVIAPDILQRQLDSSPSLSQPFTARVRQNDAEARFPFAIRRQTAPGE